MHCHLFDFNLIDPFPLHLLRGYLTISTSHRVILNKDWKIPLRFKKKTVLCVTKFQKRGNWIYSTMTKVKRQSRWPNKSEIYATHSSYDSVLVIWTSKKSHALVGQSSKMAIKSRESLHVSRNGLKKKHRIEEYHKKWSTITFWTGLMPEAVRI